MARLTQQWNIKAPGINRFYPPVTERLALMCGDRGREILGESRGRLGRKARREGAALLPNEGSALVELRMDVEDGVTKTGN